MISRRHTLSLLAAAQTEKNLRVVVRFETTLGDIVVALSGDRAPGTVENFLRYVDAGLYDGGVFHRTIKMDNQPQSPVKIEVIQGGPNLEKKQSFPPIPLERTSRTGLKHVNGAISMARSGPDTATGDFFFCIGDQPELDFGGKRNPDGQGFAAFGLVLKGHDVIRKIQKSPATGQRLSPPVKIDRLRRVE
ncbi:MAG: peptidylprolyl isomerase [Acidobacteriota bacterium]|jgi:peptidyl-prolyl cis-trans isomerase A (cyclophilin A)